MPRVNGTHRATPAPTHDRRPRKSNAPARHRQAPAKRYAGRKPAAYDRNYPVNKPISQRKPSVLKEVVRYVGLAAMYGAAGAVVGGVIGTVATGSGLGVGSAIGAGVGAACGIAYGLFRAYTGRTLKRGAEGAIRVLPMAASLPTGNPMVGHVLASGTGQAMISDGLIEGADFIDHDANLDRMKWHKNRFKHSRRAAARKINEYSGRYLDRLEFSEPEEPRRKKASKPKAKRRTEDRVYA
ncbi:hypothetical protein ACWJJH_11465 [Endozoicomonadaceae bacterium StTr2]